MKMMIKPGKLLFILLLIMTAVQLHAQTIDSFRVTRSTSPHKVFVRTSFPDSTYYISRTFDRVAMMYPPVNIVTLFYRKCDFVKAPPVKDTTIDIFTPEPYKLWVWLVRDSNTVTQGCTLDPQIQNTDSVSYDSQYTVIAKPGLEDNAISIFPNPAINTLHIAGGKGYDLRISDVQGRQYLSQKLQSEQETVNISTLIPGVYYIHCYINGQLLQSHCFNKLQ